MRLMSTRMNWLKCIGACSFHGKLGLSHECRWGERETTCMPGLCCPLRASVPAVSCSHQTVSSWGFPPLSSIDLCFFLHVDTTKSAAVVPRFMSILNCPQSTQSHAEHNWTAGYLLKALPVLASVQPCWSASKLPGIIMLPPGVIRSMYRLC